MPVTVPGSEKTMILDVSQPQGGWLNVRFAMWFPVTPGNELPLANFTSAWKDIAAKDTTLANDLSTGTMVEKVYAHDFPVGMTLPQVESFIQTAWTAVSNYLATVPQPGQFYGTYWDGTTWTKA